MIKVKNLYHSYSNDDKYAVNDISFQVDKGEIFGFLGPSGAGKSTTQNILVGLLQLQKGEVQVAGYDVKEIKNKMFNKIGMSFEQSNVYINTNLAAAAGMIAAMLMVQVLYRKVDLTMALNGALAGLVSITAGPATPSPGLALLIGGVGGILVVLAVPFFDKFKIDDVVGALSVHLVGGIWGTLAVPISNSETSFLAQLIGVAAIGAFVVIASTIVWLLIKFTIGLRVSEEEEHQGCDQAELGLEAYPEFGRGSQMLR